MSSSPPSSRPDVDQQRLLHDLTPVAEHLLERHLKTAREWFPHELVPWSEGRDFEAGWRWCPEDAKGMTPGVRSAVFVNLLTEDNLPYYFRDLERTFGRDGPWGTWVRRWTAEEGRHAIVIRDYATVSRVIDPVDLERGRMAQLSGGEVPAPEGMVDVLVYVALQELATRIAHLNTGKELSDRAGYEIMKRVAADENLHHLYYRDLVHAALDHDPSLTMLSIERQVASFHMPGTGVPGFGGHARAIAAAGIYDLAIHFEQILVPVVLRNWGIENVEGLSGPAEQARVSLVAHLERLGRLAERYRSRHAADATVRTTEEPAATG